MYKLTTLSYCNKPRYCNAPAALHVANLVSNYPSACCLYTPHKTDACLLSATLFGRSLLYGYKVHYWYYFSCSVGIICKVIRCQRWPGIKKHRALQTADDIRLEEIESYNNRQESPGSANFDNLPQTTNTHQRGTSPGGSTRSPPPRGQVVTTNPNPEGVYDQVSARASYTPRPLEVQVEMSEVQQQQPVVLYPTQYQLSQPFNERSGRWYIVHTLQ